MSKLFAIWGALVLPFFLVFPGLCEVPQLPSFQLVYFLSPTCHFCAKATPVVNELAKKYKVVGQLYGAGDTSMIRANFPIVAGDKDLPKKYRLSGVPVLVLLKGDEHLLTFNGAEEIAVADKVIALCSKGTLPLNAASAGPTGKKVQVIAWLKRSKTSTAERPKYFVTDNVGRMWLDVGSLAKKVVSGLEQLVNKPLVMTGVVGKSGQDFVLKAQELQPIR